MGYIQNWVVTISAVTMVIAIVAVIVPKNSAGRAVMLCGGIIMTAVLVLPLKNIGVYESGEVDNGFLTEIRKSADKALESNEKISADIIESRFGEYILKRAEQEGISCTAKVSCDNGIPVSAVITTESERIDDISGMISKELGIASENQIFICEV